MEDAHAPYVIGWILSCSSTPLWTDSLMGQTVPAFSLPRSHRCVGGTGCVYNVYSLHLQWLNSFLWKTGNDNVYVCNCASVYVIMFYVQSLKKPFLDWTDTLLTLLTTKFPLTFILTIITPYYIHKQRLWICCDNECHYKVRVQWCEESDSLLGKKKKKAKQNKTQSSWMIHCLHARFWV